MSREITVEVKVRVKVEIDDIEYHNQVSTDELIDTVMENVDYDFNYDDDGLRIVNQEIEEWSVSNG